MKLYSYQEANHWYRQAHLTDAGISATPEIVLISFHDKTKTKPTTDFYICVSVDKDQNGAVAQKVQSEHLTYRGETVCHA